MNRIQMLMTFYGAFRQLSVQITSVQYWHYNRHYYGMYLYIGGFMATARLDIRLDEELKAKAEKASALLVLKALQSMSLG